MRVDTKLNKFLWSQGIKAVPGRVRVRLARKRNDDEEAAEKLYTLCTHIPVRLFHVHFALHLPARLDAAAYPPHRPLSVLPPAAACWLRGAQPL